VAQALESLADDHREVVRLRRFEHRTVPEIAELMGRSENAVRILYCRALKALRAALKNGVGGPGPEGPASSESR